MQLYDLLVRQGERLFRYRSFLPFLFAIPFAAALSKAQWLETAYGDRVDDIYDWSCVAICAAGAAIRWAVAGTVPRRTSGRNTAKGQVADSLNTTGVYSVVRHPLYLGNFLMFLGVILTPGVWWLALFGSVAYWAYYERIMLAEEAFLRGRFGETFVAWAERTPAVIPALSKWIPSALSYSWRTALKREYLSVLSLLAALAALDYLEDAAAVGLSAVEWEGDTTLPFLTAFAACVVIRMLRKNTRLLSVPGR